MRHTRQGPRWWNVWLPLILLLLGGLLLLEPESPLSPAGHSIVQVVLALLIYGVVVIWLRYNRGALLNKEYEREQAQGRAFMARQPRQEPIIHDNEPWDEAWPPWQSHEHDADRQRKGAREAGCPLPTQWQRGR